MTTPSTTTPSMTVPAATPVRRHPFRQLARVEALLFARSIGAVVWTVLLPVAAVVVLGLVPATRNPSTSFAGRSPLEVYLPILMMYVLLMAAVNLLPAVLAGYRENGVLRRLSTTPVPPRRLLGAQALIYLSVGVVVDAVLLAVGVGFGVPVPRQFAGFVVSLLLVAAATLGIGLLVTALTTGERTANALSLVLFFPLMFFAGLWVPRPSMPPVLRTISDYSPLGAGVRAVDQTLQGSWPAAAPLLVLAAWAVACSAAAARWFRWQ